VFVVKAVLMEVSRNFYQKGYALSVAVGIIDPNKLLNLKVMTVVDIYNYNYVQVLEVLLRRK